MEDDAPALPLEGSPAAGPHAPVEPEAVPALKLPSITPEASLAAACNALLASGGSWLLIIEEGRFLGLAEARHLEDVLADHASWAGRPVVDFLAPTPLVLPLPLTWAAALNEVTAARAWEAPVIFTDAGGALLATTTGSRVVQAAVAQWNRDGRTTQELSSEVARLGEANRQHAVFLANMSHEIRTPMNGVIGLLNILLRSGLDQQQHGFATTARSSAETLVDIINDILDFTKIEAGKLSLERVRFDLASVFEESVQLLAPRFREKNLRLIAGLPPDLPTAVEGDPTRLRQILLNLLGNGLKFTSEGEVEIGVEQVRKTVRDLVIRVTVRDTGIGIEEAARERLFQPFEQAAAETARRYGGSGLGLAISRSLVEAMEGELSCTSSPGEGSTFSFTARFDRQFPRSADEEGAAPELAGKRVALALAHPREAATLAAQLNAWAVEVIRLDAPGDLGAHDLLVLDAGRFHEAAWAEPRSQARAVLAVSALAAAPPPDFPTDDVAWRGWLALPVRRQTLRSELARALGCESRRTVHRPTLGADGLAPHTHQLRVLLAEDDPTQQLIARVQLEQMGHLISVVANGREALEAAAEEPYDAILMDGYMPVLNGLEATRELRAADGRTRDPEVYIIAMTAAAMRGDRERFLQAGMNDYVSKPVVERELHAALGRAIEHQLTSGRTLPAWQPPGELGSDEADAIFGDDITLENLDASWDENVLANPAMLTAANDEAASPHSNGPGPRLPPAVRARVVQQFFQETPRRLQSLRGAISEGDRETAAMIAHTIAGSSSYLGDESLTRVCRQIEALAHEAHHDALAPLVSEAEETFARQRSQHDADDA